MINGLVPALLTRRCSPRTMAAFLGLGPLFDLHLPNLIWIHIEIRRYLLQKCLDARSFDGPEDAMPKLDRTTLEPELFRILSDKIYIMLGNNPNPGDYFNMSRAVNFTEKNLKLGSPIHYIVDKAYYRILRLLLEQRGNAELLFHQVTPMQRAYGKYNMERFPLDDPYVDEYEEPPLHPKPDLMIEMSDYVMVIRVLHCFGADSKAIYVKPNYKLTPELEEEFKKVRRFDGRDGIAKFFEIIVRCIRQGNNDSLKEFRNTISSWNIGFFGEKYKDFDHLKGLPFEMWLIVTAKGGNFEEHLTTFCAINQK